ncbi:MAG: NDP-hexose 2,3-dehydratase [Herbinix sp.]|jgi:oxidase EvaA|nr:NDP-hexose 2,3-dehydratase [Herbinix sp.]
MNKQLLYMIIQSWSEANGNVNGLDDILKWVDEINQNTFVKIEKRAFGFDNNWIYKAEENGIVHKSNQFFSIKGFQQMKDNKVIKEQPIIIQKDIGYLGFICKEIDGVLNFLIQAKIEPGNLNNVQISPTLQATKSNFMQVHGGKKPLYLDYFMDNKHEVIVDVLQSEHSNYFLGKRNRNIIIKVDAEVKVAENYMWVTLGQIKKMLKIDNLINMDTRTVISCIPFQFEYLNDKDIRHFNTLIRKKSLLNSMTYNDGNVIYNKLLQYINNYKMMADSETFITDLFSLYGWKYNKEKTEFFCEKTDTFSLLYCGIEIEGREVNKWAQPMIKSEGIKTCGLLQCVDNGITKYLLSAVSQIGCSDKIEIGPAVNSVYKRCAVKNEVDNLFWTKYANKVDVVIDVLLSEEGGRFYKEQSQNVIIEIQKDELDITKLSGYFWVDFHTVNKFILIGNYVNIQLRNLMALIEL